jgi:hypothetical protein
VSPAFFDDLPEFFLLIGPQKGGDAQLTLIEDGLYPGMVLASDLAHGKMVLMDDLPDLHLLPVIQVQFARQTRDNHLFPAFRPALDERLHAGTMEDVCRNGPAGGTECKDQYNSDNCPEILHLIPPAGNF